MNCLTQVLFVCILSVLLKGKDFESRTQKSHVHCKFTVSFAISITSKIFKTKTGNGYNTYVNIDWNLG